MIVLLVVVTVFFIQFIHQSHVNEYQNHEDVDRSLLGKPKPKLESTHSDAVKLVNQEDSENIGNEKPYTHENPEVPEILFPVCFCIFLFHNY